jgi:HAE1 family hydrophobic/amphiphilic exporter-1
VEFPIATVTAIYPGASPETIETKVVDKLEESINTITGIKILRSTSMENLGQVVVQFKLERDADEAVQDVRDKVSSVLRQLPQDMEPPVVEKFDFGSIPVMSIVVSGKLPIRELTRVAEDVVKQKLQAISGVGGVEVIGGRTREFQVWLDPRKLDARHLTAFEVMQALRSQNVELPGGRLNLANREYVLKTRGEVHSAKELGAIIITAAGGTTVRISDVARVEDGQQEARSFSSLNGKSAVVLLVRKQSGGNTVAVAHALRKAVKQLRKQVPKGVGLKMPVDNSVFIERSIHDVQFDVALGALLAVLIILFFLHDYRATIISALAIPTSIVATFAFIHVMDFTFNVLTMLGMALSIGILVDDAIVVIEAIHRQVQLGHKPLKAASIACEEIGLAVMATTASIIAVFIPVAFMDGMMGRFFLQFGLTVAFAVAVSLFVAFSLTPALAARWLKTHDRKGPVARTIDRGLARVDSAYRRLLAAALRHRVASVLVATVTLFASFGLVTVIPLEFMPDEDRSDLMVNIELPTGTDLQTTRRRVAEIDETIRKVPGVVLSMTTIGAGVAQEVNKAQIQVNLVPSRKRKFSQLQMMAHVREVLAKFKGATISVEKVDPAAGSAGFRQQAVQFNIRGNDYEAMQKSALALVAELKKAGGYVDLDTTYRGGKPEVRVDIDRDRAADLGVPIQVIAATLRAFIAGDKVNELSTSGDRFDVRVRLPDEARRSLENVTSLRVRSASGQLVPLSAIVKVSAGEGPSTIERQSRRRQVTVLANVENKALGTAIEEVNLLAAKVVPSKMDQDWGGMGEMMLESFRNMVLALLLAVILIYLILAAQFESFVHPFTIMLSLPLSFVGALGALALSQTPIGIFAMIGVIMLMGIVTKNAILLVDYANLLRSRGSSIHEALLEAGPVRLRPILMTTLATVGGMLPVAMALGEGGKMRAPMAIAVIGGLITSTLLTLVVVPVAYSLLDGLASRLGGVFGRKSKELKEAADDPPEEASGVSASGSHK